jgi:hypothetical protein
MVASLGLVGGSMPAQVRYDDVVLLG